MIPEPQYVTGYRSGLRTDWWLQSFCVEVDWHHPDPTYSRLATVFWEPFTPASFERAVRSIMQGLLYWGSIESFLEVVREYGHLRIRAGAIWCQGNYKGDWFDLPVILEPFNRFPFGRI